MGFSNLRKSLGSKYKKNCYELIRFATCGNIPGIGSKLFHSFKKKYNPEEIISYCDLRWGNGNFYKKLGFDIQHITEPNYWYTKDFQKREHRFKYRKSELIKNGSDENLTESEIMKNLGYSKIWDCGNSKWMWSYNKL